MSEIQGRIFNFKDVSDTIAQNDNLGLRWQANLYEQLFLEQGVAPLVKFQASFVQPGVFTEYETPYKELLNGLQKYYNYQSNELIIFLND